MEIHVIGRGPDQRHSAYL